MSNANIVAIVLAVALSGCAVQSSEPADDDLVRASQAALSSSARHDLWTLYARAQYDATTDVTNVTLDTRDPLAEADPRILTDRFVAVMVYRLRGDGVRDLLATLRGEQIGPGGGCIHFKVRARAGERLLIGAVVKLTGVEGAQLAAVPDGTIVRE